MKNRVFWDLALSQLVNGNQVVQEDYRTLLQNVRNPLQVDIV